MVNEADTAALVELLAQAFYDDPFAVWIEPDDDRRLDSLRSQFGALCEVVFARRRVIDTVPGPKAQAVWAPPGSWELTDEEGPNVGARLAEALGDSIERVGGALEEIGARHPSQPHWYLELLATDPALRGHGLGGGLLQAGCARVDADGVGAYLWTANERNVGLYQRHGFEVSWTDRVMGGPQLWGMWRSAQG